MTETDEPSGNVATTGNPAGTPGTEYPGRREPFAQRMLAWIGRVFRMDAAPFLRAGFWLAAALGFYQLIRFAETVGFAHLATPDLLGRYVFVLAVVQLLSILSLPGMDEAILQSVAGGHEGSLRVGTRIRLRASLLGSAALLAIGAWFWWQGDLVLARILVVLAPLFPLATSFSSHVPYVLGKGEYRIAAARSVLMSAAYLAAVVVALATTGNLFVIVLASLATGAAGHAWFWSRTARGLPSHATDAGLGRQGLHLTALSAFDYTAPHMDKLVVTYLLGFGPFAIYYVSALFATQAAAAALVAKPVLLHRFARPGANHRARLPADVARVMAITAPLVVMGILVAPWLVPFLFTDQYVEAVRPTQVVLGYVLFAVPTMVLQAYFQARRRTGALYAQRAVSQGLNVLLLFVLVPGFGILGAVAAKVAAGAIALVHMLVLLVSERTAPRTTSPAADGGDKA